MKDFVDRLAYHGLRFVKTLANILPYRAALALGRGIGWIAFYFTSRRRAAYADLKAALDRELTESGRRRILRRQFQNFGQMFAEILRFPSLTKKDIDRYIRIHHYERYDEALKGGKGIICLTGHFGNWELTQTVSGLLGYPIHVLGQPQKHSRLDRYLNELREIHAAKAVTTEGFGIRSLFKALQRKEIIGLLGDQTAGRHEGLILPFLGRKTTVPTGAFELARRTGAALIPCFIVRNKGPYHDLYVEKPIDCLGPDEDLKGPVREYLQVLEDYIRRYPDQWLWETKRWKYTWTKRLLILSDGKAGHEKQAKAVASHFRCLETQYGRPGMEYPTEVLRIEFKTPWHQRLFYTAALLYFPWAQGRLVFLKFFLKKHCFEKLVKSSADFVLSAGAGLVPLNLCVAKDSRAKSIVIMSPSFPYNLFRYDLVLRPAHDGGWGFPAGTYRTLLTPSEAEGTVLEADAEKLKTTLRNPKKIKIGVFLGGPTHRFKMEISTVESLFSSLERLSKKLGDYMVTTSRRTPDTVSRYFRQQVLRDPSCQLFVAAKEDPRPEVAGGMMSIAEILIVTEDSISMISEAVSSGKKVIVLESGVNGLPAKHKRFKKLLTERSGITLARPENLEQTIERLQHAPASGIVHEEVRALRKKLQEIL